MRRFTREDMIREGGARPEELADLEARRLLVPIRPWRLFGGGEEYYTEGQLEVLRYIVKARRVVGRTRPGRPGLNGVTSAGARWQKRAFRSAALDSLLADLNVALTLLSLPDTPFPASRFQCRLVPVRPVDAGLAR